MPGEMCAALGRSEHCESAQELWWLLQFQDIVVSVARKTDAAMWPALFLAVGVPSELLNNLVDAGALASAACCLLIVDRIEGSATAHSSALRLIKASALLTSHAEPAQCTGMTACSVGCVVPHLGQPSETVDR